MGGEGEGGRGRERGREREVRWCKSKSKNRSSIIRNSKSNTSGKREGGRGREVGCGGSETQYQKVVRTHTNSLNCLAEEEYKKKYGWRANMSGG